MEDNIEMQRELIDRFDQFVNSIKDISEQYGPQAIEAVMTAMYLDAF